MKTFLEELNDAAITIQDHFIVKIINFLGLKFEMYITVWNEKARNEKMLPDLDILLKTLGEEEIRSLKKNLLNNIQTGSSGRSSKNSQNSRDCGSWGDCDGQKEQDSQGEAKSGSSTTNYSDARCHSCQKKGHIANFCK